MSASRQHKTMEKFTLKQLRENIEIDNLFRKANKSSNAPILKLIDLIGNDKASITCERGKSDTLVNRGSAVECLIKLLFKNQKNAKRYTNDNGRADMSVNGVKYEIKYSSAKGYAHYNPKQNLDNLVFVDSTGVYLTSGKNIILDKCGKHIKTIKMTKDTTQLVDFDSMEVLGTL